MAEILIEVRMILQEAVAELRKFGKTADDVAQGVQKAGAKLANFGTSIKQVIGGAAIVHALGSVHNQMTQIDRKAGDVDEAFLAMGESALEGAGKARLAWGRVLGNMADAISLGATKSLTHGDEKQSVDENRVARGLQTQAKSAEALAKQLEHLQDLKRTEEAKGSGFEIERTDVDQTRQTVLDLNDSIAKTVQAIQDLSASQVEMFSNSAAGAKETIALETIRIAKEQRLAEIANEMRASAGTERTSADLAAWQARVKAVETEANLQTANLKVTQAQSFIANSIALAETKTGVTYQEQSDFLKEIAMRSQEVAAFAGLTLGRQSETAIKLQAAAHAANKVSAEFDIQRGFVATNAELQASAARAQMEANKQLAGADQEHIIVAEYSADMSKIEADFTVKIAQAERTGDAREIAALKEQKQIAQETADLKRKEADFQNKSAIRQSALNIAAINAEASGNSQIAALAKIRAQYEEQITQAMRDRKPYLAAEKAHEMAMAVMGADVAELLKTPKQKRDEIKEQQRVGHAEKIVANREKQRQDEIAKMDKTFGLKGHFTERESDRWQQLMDGQVGVPIKHVDKGGQQARDFYAKAFSTEKLEVASMKPAA